MSTETIALGLPPVPRERRSRAELKPPHPSPVRRKSCSPPRAVTAQALTVP